MNGLKNMRRSKLSISALIESLPKLVDNGLSDRQIANMFGVSETTVQNYKKKLGIKVNKNRKVFKGKVLKKRELIQLIKDKWIYIKSCIELGDEEVKEKAIDALRLLFEHVDSPNKQELTINPTQNRESLK